MFLRLLGKEIQFIQKLISFPLVGVITAMAIETVIMFYLDFCDKTIHQAKNYLLVVTKSQWSETFIYPTPISSFVIQMGP